MKKYNARQNLKIIGGTWSIFFFNVNNIITPEIITGMKKEKLENWISLFSVLIFIYATKIYR